MSKLEAALAWAARGFPVFPLLPDGKHPAYEGAWYDISTTDPDRIRSYWLDPVLRTEHDYNIGVDCTDRVVIDLDVKDGKNGIEEYMHIAGTAGWNTLTVRTPTGGLHLYFEGPDSGNSPISKSIDVRSHHGYVVGPGSTIGTGAYEVVRDMEPSWLPFTVEQLCAGLYSRRDTAYQGTDDTQAKIAAVSGFLQSAPVAVEGERGDDVTFQTAARCVREYGLSPHATFELMRDIWNERCLPPWSLDELLRKVENASNYGTAEIGRLDADLLFAGLDIEPPPTILEQRDLTWGNAPAIGGLVARPWLMDKILLTGQLTAIISQGAVGKSTLGLLLAAHIVQGLPFNGQKVHKRCRVVIYNGEDDVGEQSLRLQAICMSMGFDYDEVKQHILLLSEEEIALHLVTQTPNGTTVQEQLVQQLIDVCSDPDVGLLILDPLVDVHLVNEGDPSQMNMVMSTIRRIVKRSKVAGLIMAHATKGGESKQEDRVGNADIARGSSAIINKTRITFTLLNASESDAEAFGFQQSDRRLWVRMDDAKMNLTLGNEKTMWFHREGVLGPTGDIVGVLRPRDLSKNTNILRTRIADAIVSQFLLLGTSTMPFPQVVAFVKQAEPLWSNKTDIETRQKLEQFFQAPVIHREYTLQIERSEDRKVLLVMS